MQVSIQNDGPVTIPLEAVPAVVSVCVVTDSTHSGDYVVTGSAHSGQHVL